MPVLNIFRSWKSNCWQGQAEILDALKVYTDKELCEIVAHGYNAVWLRADLREVTSSKIFPEFGKRNTEYLKILSTLVKRAKKHKIDLYLYCTEPLALPVKDKFWKNNNDVRGEKYYWPYEDKGYYYALCTSTQKVRDYLEDSFYLLFREVKGLAGIITITASEALGSCYSHIDVRGRYLNKEIGVWKSFSKMDCPRCKSRPAGEVIAELLNTMHTGITKASSGAKLIAWNWSWDLFYPDPQKEIISRFNRNIIIMSGFERGGSKRILGRKRCINEYSLSYTGPSEKFKKVHILTRKTGHRLMTKLQVGTTHELGTVPNMPLLGNLYKKAEYVKSRGIYGAMATWNFGNMRTLNTYAFGQAMKKNKFDQTVFYDDIIRGYLKITPADLTMLKKAWSLFVRAMDNYPFSIAFLYESPVNYAPGYWLLPRKTKGTSLGRSWMLDKNRGDDLGATIKEYGLAKTIAGFEIICRKWDEGTKIYETVFKGKRERNIKEEHSCALAIGHIFRTTLHLYKVYDLCRRWDKVKHMRCYLELCRKELQNCQSLYPLLLKDKRIGFHAECQGYMFDKNSVRDKINRLTEILK